MVSSVRFGSDPKVMCMYEVDRFPKGQFRQTDEFGMIHHQPPQVVEGSPPPRHTTSGQILPGEPGYVSHWTLPNSRPHFGAIQHPVKVDEKTGEKDLGPVVRPFGIGGTSYDTFQQLSAEYYAEDARRFEGDETAFHAFADGERG